MIGGRFVGLKNDPQVREEFNTWVKANAYLFSNKTWTLKKSVCLTYSLLLLKLSLSVWMKKLRKNIVSR